jgi:small conductance mechanosensitive channel
MQTLIESLLNPYFSEPFLIDLSRILTQVLSIILIFLAAYLFKTLILKGLLKWMKKHHHSSRSNTIDTLIKTTVNGLMWFVIILLVLDILGINITPILASAGVLGLAIGFGSQNLVKDIVAGLFHFIDNNYNVGETIEVNGFMGTVTKMTLRNIHVTNFLGAEKIIPQGLISSLINWSRNDNAAIVDFGVAYNTDLKKLNDVMNGFMDALKKNYEVITETPMFLGVIELSDSQIVCRILAKATPGNHFALGRNVRKDLIETLAQNNIEIPFPHLVVKNG